MVFSLRGAPPFVAVSLMPRVLQDLLCREPPVVVLLTEQRVPQLHRLLLDGELDALVTTYSWESGDSAAPERLCYEKLFETEVVVIAAADWRPKRPVSWKSLAAERWILPEVASYIRGLAEDMFLRAGVMTPDPVIQSTNPMTTTHLVAQGLGLGVVPAPASEAAEREGRVTRVRVSPSIPTAPVALVYREEARKHPRIQFLRAALERR